MELSELEQSKSKTSRRTNFRNVKMELVIPLFTGVWGSLLLCALFAILTGFFSLVPVTAETEIYIEEEQENSYWSLALIEKSTDIVMEYYRDLEYQEWVIDFFSGICSNREIAQAILHNADEFNVPVALAFSLSWEESRFNPRAVNRYNRDGSIDRGLFQLNNRSFPNLDINAFFNIQTNARYGISHLKHCLNTGSTEVSALAMYNAGTGRVTTTGAPKVTLNYISRILENRSRIESRFHTMLIREEERRLQEEQSQQIQEQNAPQPGFRRTLITASPL